MGPASVRSLAVVGLLAVLVSACVQRPAPNAQESGPERAAGSRKGAQGIAEALERAGWRPQEQAADPTRVRHQVATGLARLGFSPDRPAGCTTVVQLADAFDRHQRGVASETDLLALSQHVFTATASALRAAPGKDGRLSEIRFAADGAHSPVRIRFLSGARPDGSEINRPGELPPVRAGARYLLLASRSAYVHQVTAAKVEPNAYALVAPPLLIEGDSATARTNSGNMLSIRVADAVAQGARCAGA